MLSYRYKVRNLEGVKMKKEIKWTRNFKVVYDLEIIKKEFKGVENMPILQGKSFSYSVRNRFYTPDSIIEFYDREHNFLGQEANSIGPYGKSDFWTYDEYGHVISTESPEVNFSVFEDRLYNVIVVRA